MEETYHSPKMTPKQWIANFWYYNKWFFLLGVVAVVFIGICTVQFFSKKDADLSLLILHDHEVKESTCDAIVKTAEGFLPDVNADGHVTVEIAALSLHEGFEKLNQRRKDEAREDIRQYYNEILGGDACLLIVDPAFFQELSASGALIDLKTVFTELPEGTVNGYGIRLGETQLYRSSGFADLPDDMILCLKYPSVVSGKDDAARAEEQVVQEEIFRSFYLGKPFTMSE